MFKFHSINFAFSLSPRPSSPTTAIACGSGDNEPGLKFTNLSAARVSGLRGKSLQLFCGGQDARGEQLKYEWLFNGSPIKDNDFRFAHKANGTVLEVRKLYLVMKNASKSTGRYNCLLSNSNGSILSRNIFLISTTREYSCIFSLLFLCHFR